MPQVDPQARVEELDELTATALDNRSELSALLNKSSALALQGKAERASALPTVGFNATYRYLENDALDDQNLASVALGVSWALYDGGLAGHRASALEQQAQSARDLNADLDSGIRLQVRSAWLTINEARNRMAVAAKGRRAGRSESEGSQRPLPERNRNQHRSARCRNTAFSQSTQS